MPRALLKLDKQVALQSKTAGGSASEAAFVAGVSAGRTLKAQGSTSSEAGSGAVAAAMAAGGSVKEKLEAARSSSNLSSGSSTTLKIGTAVAASVKAATAAAAAEQSFAGAAERVRQGKWIFLGACVAILIYVYCWRPYL